MPIDRILLLESLLIWKAQHKLAFKCGAKAMKAQGISSSFAPSSDRDFLIRDRSRQSIYSTDGGCITLFRQ